MELLLLVAFLRFRTLLLMNDEVLYEDPTLQIGIKASYKGLSGTVHIYYGNHSPVDLQSLNVSIQSAECEPLGIVQSQLPSVLGAKQQLCQVSGLPNRTSTGTRSF